MHGDEPNRGRPLWGSSQQKRFGPKGAAIGAAIRLPKSPAFRAPWSRLSGLPQGTRTNHLGDRGETHSLGPENSEALCADEAAHPAVSGHARYRQGIVRRVTELAIARVANEQSQVR